MKKETRFGAVLLFLAALGLLGLNPHARSASAQLSAALSSGLTITEATTSGGKTTTSTVYFSGNAIKRVAAEGDESIIQLDPGKIIIVNHKQKTYTEVTFQELQTVIDAAAAAMNDSPEAKGAMEMMKKMMGGKSGPVTVTSKGPGGTVAGYPTQQYLVTGPLEMEIWAAPDLKVPPAYFDAAKLRMPANPFFDMRQVYDAFKKIDGWPVKTAMKMSMFGKDMSSTTEATSIQKGAIPASTFEVPQGYKLVKEKFQK